MDCSGDKKPALIGNSTLSADSSCYLGNEICSGCHSREFELWNHSHHKHSMEHANQKSVLGDFDSSVFKSDGVEYLFYHKKNKYFMTVTDMDNQKQVYEVKYTFGFEPLQQYLIEFPGGRLQTTRVSWNTKKEKWFHQLPGQSIDQDDWLHWTNQSMNWNSMCADCHSTGLQKNYDPENNDYHTKWEILNVGCEGCHGMGSRHVQYVNSEGFQNGRRVEHSYLDLTKGISNVQQVESCAPCHSRRVRMGTEDQIHDGFLNQYKPELISNDHYFTDGQIKDENFVYGSFVQSKMYHNGVMCTDCHDPHTLKLKDEGNRLCINCHESAKYDVPVHHHHAINSEGSQCISCHMPGKFYMGNDFRRDHSLRIPRPDQSVKYGAPNACNNCHVDKPDEWSDRSIVSWYGQSRMPHFSDALLSVLNYDQTSIESLMNLLGDTSQPDIARATALYYLRTMVPDQISKIAITYLNDEATILKLEAISSMFSGEYKTAIKYLCPLLKDDNLTVRVTAANVLSGIPPKEFPAQYREPYKKANKELLSFLIDQSDFPNGQLTLGGYYERIGDAKSAEIAYSRGLKIDSLFNQLSINLASLYSRENDFKKAEKTINSLIQRSPEDWEGYYLKGLLYYEKNNSVEALSNFRMAYQYGSSVEKVVYHYGVILAQQGNLKLSKSILTKGVKLFPQSERMKQAFKFVFEK